ncbi:MAG: AAA family ATPase [Arenicellales bacterium]|nr:AAA family ATPase [Arenicellales bacterium]
MGRSSWKTCGSTTHRTPPGYVGYEDGGYLTEVDRRKPYAVILIDQVEKTRPDVFNILLQVLDDGRLTDSQGRMVSFSNTIVIMTTHLGSECLHRLVDHRNAAQLRNEVLSAVQEHF